MAGHSVWAWMPICFYISSPSSRSVNFTFFPFICAPSRWMVGIDSSDLAPIGMGCHGLLASLLHVSTCPYFSSAHACAMFDARQQRTSSISWGSLSSLFQCTGTYWVGSPNSLLLGNGRWRTCKVQLPSVVHLCYLLHHSQGPIVLFVVCLIFRHPR
jgi:hypothetical protein